MADVEKDAEDGKTSPPEHQEHHDGTSEKAEAELDFEPAEERRMLWKADIRVVTLVFLLYSAAFLDRSNIGNANTAGMSKDLGFTNGQYTWLLTIFCAPSSSTSSCRRC